MFKRASRRGSGINAEPITYTHKGKQPQCTSGRRRCDVARMGVALAKVRRGGSVWTLALMD